MQGQVTFSTFSSETDPKINSHRDENIDLLLLQEDFPGMRPNGQSRKYLLHLRLPNPHHPVKQLI